MAGDQLHTAGTAPRGGVGITENALPNPVKEAFLAGRSARHRALTRVGNSQLLYAVGGNAVRVYIRYPRVREGGQGFYGLRSEDIALLQGHRCELLPVGRSARAAVRTF